MIEQNNFLQGQLVGIGKIHTDGSEDFRWLEKPIKNRIVSSGLDHLLTLNGNQVVSYSEKYSTEGPLICFWVGRTNYSSSSASNNRCGVLQYASYGSSGDSTEFTDTALHAKVGGYSSSKRTGAGNCGTQIRSYGNFIFRVTHIHTAAPSGGTTVREIGWFYDIVSSSTPSTYKMFSRVVLDTPYELLAGEQLVTTYEVNLVMGNRTPVAGASFFGLLDRDGNPLQYETKLCLAQKRASMSWVDSTMSFPYIKASDCTGNIDAESNGSSGGTSYDMRFATIYPAYNCRREYYRQLSYNGGATHFYNNPTDGYMDQYAPSLDAGSLPSSYNWGIRDYQWGSFYRDAYMTIPRSWPYLGSDAAYADIRFLMVGGVGISFGHYETDPDTGTQSWVPQYYRKYGNKSLGITIRQRFSTVDTPAP